MAMDAPAKVTLKCIQAKKVRSLAKKTLGSILPFVLRRFFKVPSSIGNGDDDDDDDDDWWWWLPFPCNACVGP